MGAFLGSLLLWVLVERPCMTIVSPTKRRSAQSNPTTVNMENPISTKALDEAPALPQTENEAEVDLLKQLEEELQNQFHDAADLIRNGKPKKNAATNSEKVCLYGLYKQATCGDCTEQ